MFSVERLFRLVSEDHIFLGALSSFVFLMKIVCIIQRLLYWCLVSVLLLMRESTVIENY